MDFLPLIGRSGDRIASCKMHLHVLVGAMPDETTGNGEWGSCFGDGKLESKNLAWVHDVIGIERLLDGAHNVHRLPMLGD
jgi:hypothetical protein